MYIGKTLFAQLMDFLPWTTFTRIVDRYAGNHRVRTLPCAENFRVLAFAQLTYRESLRDIEACLSAQSAKLYHMGIRSSIKRSTLADANERRDWRIYAEFAQRLIAQARKLYADEDLGLNLSNTLYALDSTTIDLCLSLFPWAPFRSTKAAVKMHTLLDLRGNIPSFIHVSDGKMHDVNALDLLIPEPAAIYVMDRAYLDFERLFGLHDAGAFVKVQIWTDVSVYVLVAIIKKHLDLQPSLYTLLQVFSITLFEKIPLNKDFLDTRQILEGDMISNQLNLFNN